MFDRLTDRLQDTFRNLSGRGVLSEKNITDALRDVRRALLEADVNYTVVKNFIATCKEQCLGEKVLKSIKPGQQAVKIVNDELAALLGEGDAPLVLTGKPAVIMMVGLHGSGKTTTTAKLARLLGKDGKKVMVAACDLHRPAAIDQLEFLGKQLDIPVFLDRGSTDVAKLAGKARQAAEDNGSDVLIIDTAGRHQIDEVLVQQLADVRKRTLPAEILLVADAALGQEAVSVAEHFNEALEVTGIVLTKLDGDARGGAALSMRQVTGKPIKFIGVGEGMDDLQTFHPERMASRILGMGDVVSLVEKASEHFEEEEAKRLEEKMRKQTFDFDDFLGQLKKLKRMGGLLSLLDMLPGMGKLKQLPVDEKQFTRIEGIIHSMTPFERQNPDSLSSSRCARIARGSGVDAEQVNQLVQQFNMMKKMMGNMDQMQGMMEAMQGGGMPGMGGGMPGMPGMGMPGMGGGAPKRGARFTKPKKKKKKKRR
ncbi:MAG: signal recognition particle protein [Lentisphaeria bacterium]|nr:signal recognition particle protein [Lentisphaeria bacterium]